MSNRGEMNIILQPRQQMRLDMQPSSHASRVGDYNELLNKPSVNDVELIGNKTSENLKIIISKAAEDWDSYADVVSYKDTAYVYVGPVTKIKYGDGVTTIGNLPFVSAEDARISNEDITAWNAKADISDIPTTLAELSDDTTHRLVTDDEKARWDSTVGNVQSDWNEADPSAGSYIKNKPDIPDDLADLNADATHRLVTDTEKSTWNNKSDFSGSYTDLTNKPDIPANLSDLQDDASHRLTSDAEKTAWNAKSDFSGNYNDLTNKPDIPNDLADLNEDSTHRVVTDVEKAAWNAKSDFSGSYNDLTNKPKLADLTDDASHRTVSDSEKLSWDRKSDFSGSYDDLTDKPDIPDELTDLGDISVANIQDGQILKYNATTQKFENANESGGTVQDAYKKVKVASTEITASGEDTIEFVAGTNVTLVPDPVNKKVTINSTGGGGGGSTGDMLKEIYDTNNDGIVNAADEATTLTGMTASVSELNALEGVTSNVQSQLDDKADASDIPTALSDLSDDSTHRVVTDAEKSAWNAKSDFSGSYNDLTDKPTIPDDLADLNEDSTHRLVTDAEKTAWDAKSDFSGSYNDLTNKPSIPDDLADLSDDATHRLVTDVEKAAWDAKSDFSGSYNDLTNKPTIPDDLADLNEDSTHRLVTDSEKATWNGKSDFSGSYNDLTDKPSIPAAQVQSDWNQASSAAVDYIKNKPSIPTDLADLSDDATHRLVTDTEKSTWDNKADVSDIPTVNNNTITIQKNGQNIDSFSLNQNSNKAINIDVPTKTSDLQNDSSFITNTVNNLANYYLKSQTYTQAEVDALIDTAVNGRFQKVNVLPATGEPNIIYLVPKATPETSNACDEYIWQDNDWELIGSTDIDLSGYVTDDELNTALADYLTTSAFNTAIANYYTKTEIGNLLDDKVDKVSGKGLSTYDYDATAKGIVDNVTTNLAGKVDKVNGKGLSTNDYDNTDKAKVGKIDTTTTSISGNPISISNLKANQLAINPIITLEPIQAGSGTPSPSNIRAISGYDKVEVLSCGKNIWVDGDVSVSNVAYVKVYLSHPIPAGTYKVSAILSNNVTSDARVSFRRSDDTGIKSVDVIYNASGRSISNDVEIEETAYIVYFYYTSPGISGSRTWSNIMITPSNASQTYEPPIKTTDLSESLGQTVYGLTHEVRTGKAKVTFKAVDMGDLDYYRVSDNVFTVTISDKKSGSGRMYCSCFDYEVNKGYALDSDCISDSNASGYATTVFIKTTASYSSSALLKTAVTGQTLVYTLATPTEIQLTPHEISLLKDYAYVSTNGTNIALDYHNGELASLSDVSQLGETVERQQFHAYSSGAKKIGTWIDGSDVYEEVIVLSGETTIGNTLTNVYQYTGDMKQTDCPIECFGIRRNPKRVFPLHVDMDTSGMFVQTYVSGAVIKEILVRFIR